MARRVRLERLEEAASKVLPFDDSPEARRRWREFFDAQDAHLTRYGTLRTDLANLEPSAEFRALLEAMASSKMDKSVAEMLDALPLGSPKRWIIEYVEGIAARQEAARERAALKSEEEQATRIA